MYTIHAHTDCICISLTPPGTTSLCLRATLETSGTVNYTSKTGSQQALLSEASRRGVGRGDGRGSGPPRWSRVRLARRLACAPSTAQASTLRQLRRRSRRTPASPPLAAAPAHQRTTAAPPPPPRHSAARALLRARAAATAPPRSWQAPPRRARAPPYRAATAIAQARSACTHLERSRTDPESKARRIY
eukprot:1313248-Pleurochrysis_carterae.AAC.3